MRYNNKLRYIFIFGLIISAYLIQFNFQNFNRIQNKSENNTFNIDSSNHIYVPFVVGVAQGPSGIDPIDTWDPYSWNVISQVCEGLFTNNLSDPDLSKVNLLAESYWWENPTTLQLKLREGVLFHDNTPFNSTAAKWNLDRIQYLISHGAMAAQLWRFPNGTSIMKQIDVVSEYNIIIRLTGPYSPFLNLLCYPGASMISPSSHSQTETINISDDLVGTGPFDYDGYIDGVEVDFHAFDDYWRGKANISKMVFSIYSNATTRRNSLLNKDIDYMEALIPSDFSMFEADPEIILAKAPNTGLEYDFLALNNNVINVTWRKAISYAINYTNLLQHMNTNFSTFYERAYSPISPGFGDAYYNCSEIAPYYNLTIARQTLINASITNLPINDDAGWQAAELAVFNFTYLTYGASTSFYAVLNSLFADYLDMIGITVVGDPLDLNDYIYKVIIYRQAEMYLWGWYPDFVDADNYFYKGLLSSGPNSENFANVNDPWLDAKIVEARNTIDESARNTIYHDIQIYLTSSLYPFVSLFHNREFFAYNAKLSNCANNVLGYLYFYPCKWTPLPALEINTPNYNSGFANTAPIFNLTLNIINYNTIWYTLDDGITNITCGISGQISPIFWDGLNDGFYALKFYIEDSEGSIGTAEVLIYKDTTAPNILINNPNENNIFGLNAPSYDLTIMNSDLLEMWYTLDGGIHNYTFNEFSGTIDQTLWNSISDGDLTIDFYASDILANVGFVSVDIVKDSQAPIIIINNPNENNIFGLNAPSYNVSISEDNLLEMWYTLDGGIHNYTFTEFSGTIDQTLWNSISDGDLTIDFYASDILANVGFVSVDIVKDSQAPIIIINNPNENNIFGLNAPSYNVSISEDNLLEMWYTIGEEGKPYIFTEFTGTINQTAWQSLAQGKTTISFYAIDLLGHIASESVVVIKSISRGLDGLNPFMLTIIISSAVGGVVIISIVYIFMKRRSRA